MKLLNVPRHFCAAGILALTTTTTQAQLPSEVEGARANARAGGPTNSHDAELLRRYGALTTGTPYRACATGGDTAAADLGRHPDGNCIGRSNVAIEALATSPTRMEVQSA